MTVNGEAQCQSSDVSHSAANDTDTCSTKHSPKCEKPTIRQISAACFSLVCSREQFRWPEGTRRVLSHDDRAANLTLRGLIVNGVQHLDKGDA
jgi:hypothetical protein